MIIGVSVLLQLFMSHTYVEKKYDLKGDNVNNSNNLRHSR